jgi:hypothetical protein
MDLDTSLPKPSLRVGCCSAYDDTVRVASKPAGPGRGKQFQKRPLSGFDQAEWVLKKAKPSYEELHTTLCKLTDEHRLLQQWYSKVQSERDRAYGLLVRKYDLGATEEEEAVREANRRAVVTELVGEGYSMSAV